jgi:hypothetical protein
MDLASFLSINTKESSLTHSLGNNSNLMYSTLDDFNITPGQETKRVCKPLKIKAFYTNDYNIATTHDQMINYLKDSKTPRLKELRKILNVEMSNCKKKQNYRNRKKTLSTIEKLKIEIEELGGETPLQRYLESALPLVEKYKSMKSHITEISHDGSIRQEELELNRIKLISDFSNICKKYADVRISHRLIFNKTCRNCGAGLEESKLLDDGSKICTKCGGEVILEEKINSNQNRINRSKASNKYNDFDNFWKSFLRFQGRQIDKIPEGVYDDLDKYFIINNFPIGSEISKLDLDNRGRRIGSNLKLLRKALKQTGNSDFFKHERLIAQIYWGWKLADLSHLDDLITKHYHSTQTDYLALNKIRISSFGTQYRLIRHLQLVGYICKIDDFKLSLDTKSLEEQERLWLELCKNSKCPDIYYIPLPS